MLKVKFRKLLILGQNCGKYRFSVEIVENICFGSEFGKMSNLAQIVENNQFGSKWRKDIDFGSKL